MDLRRSILRALVAIALVGTTLVLHSPQIAQAAACTCNLLGNITPGTPDSGPDSAVKLGLSFKTSVDGYATGVRFYKGAGNTGTHVGELWSVPDVNHAFQLAQVTFSGESATGWQTALFSQPVKLMPDANYMVSYTAPVGHYAYDTNYFNTTVTNGVLRSGDQPAGFNYTSSLGGNSFPGTATTTNYYVDVVFETYVNESTLFKTTYAQPAVPSSSDTTQYEIGTRFTSDNNTQIYGVRVYGATTWYQQRQVTLWSSTGTQLATILDPDFSVQNGWIELRFTSPVAITAGTEYVVSTHVFQNQWGYTDNFFTSPYSYGSFHAPTNAGVFTASASVVFPTTQSSTNYWVDPVFANEADVDLSVNIAPAFTFNVSGRASTCNGQAAANFQTGSSGTGVDMGHLSPATLNGGAQDLSVTTNAGNGFTVYLKTSGATPNAMRSIGGQNIADVSGNAASPGLPPAIGTAGFGYTTSDTSTAFTTNTWAKLTNSNDAVLVAAPGAGTKTVCVGYEVAASPSTSATAYTSNVVYNAVPMF